MSESGWAPDVLRDAGEDDGDVYVVGVRETADSESWSLLFMECYDADDEQEIALGMDTYCLVVDPGQATHYGGVRECEINDGELRLVLAASAAAALGLPIEKRFVLDLPGTAARAARSRPTPGPDIWPARRRSHPARSSRAGLSLGKQLTGARGMGTPQRRRVNRAVTPRRALADARTFDLVMFDGSGR